MGYYKNIEPSGNKYRARLKLGIHQTYSPSTETPQEAAQHADYLRAWLRATFPDCLAEKYENQISVVSTPPPYQDEKHKTLLASVPKLGTWAEQVQSAPEWIARFIARIMSTEDITPTTDGNEQAS